jgi:hypothetical protein
MWIAFSVGALLITVFIGKVSEALRHHEQEALQFQQRLAHHERLASIANLAAGAAHAQTLVVGLDFEPPTNVGQAGQGGISLETTFSFIDLAQGRASL